MIGLQLYQGLEKLVKELNFKFFEFHLRVSNENPTRWDHDFIQSQLEKYQTGLKRVWVCGPPRMNEDFDKSLGKIARNFGLTHADYDIL